MEERDNVDLHRIHGRERSRNHRCLPSRPSRHLLGSTFNKRQQQLRKTLRTFLEPAKNPAKPKHHKLHKQHEQTRSYQLGGLGRGASKEHASTRSGTTLCFRTVEFVRRQIRWYHGGHNSGCRPQRPREHQLDAQPVRRSQSLIFSFVDSVIMTEHKSVPQNYSTDIMRLTAKNQYRILNWSKSATAPLQSFDP